MNGACWLFVQCMSPKLLVQSTRDPSLLCTSFSNIKHIRPTNFKFFAISGITKTWDPLFFFRLLQPPSCYCQLSMINIKYFALSFPLFPPEIFLGMFKTHRTKDLKAPAPTIDARHLAVKRDKKARWYMGKGENFFFRTQNAICLLIQIPELGGFLEIFDILHKKPTRLNPYDQSRASVRFLARIEGIPGS